MFLLYKTWLQQICPKPVLLLLPVQMPSGAYALHMSQAAGHMPPSPHPNPGFREDSPCWGSRCLGYISGRKGFLGFPIALVWQVQV